MMADQHQLLMQEPVQAKESKPFLPKPTSHVLVLVRDNIAPRSSGGEWVVESIVPIVDLPKPDLLDAQVPTYLPIRAAMSSACLLAAHWELNWAAFRASV